MSFWEELNLSKKIELILDVESHESGHHFGRPFLTPYQIAIKFKEQYPDEFSKIGKPLGGKGTGQKDSLAQYIDLELSKRIKNKSIKDIEGSFLHRSNLFSLQYKTENDVITSSSEQSYDLSLYRLTEWF